MRTIFKYALQIVRHQTISMPRDAKILHLSNIDGSDYMWVEVETTNEEVVRKIELSGTGMEVSLNAKYIGTTISPDRYVGHFYEVE